MDLSSIKTRIDVYRGVHPVVFDLGPLENVCRGVSRLAHRMEALSDEALRRRADETRRAVHGGVKPDEVVVEFFAVVRETAHRRIGLRPFDNQIMAAAALHRSRVVELGTGEGKTLAAVLPAALHALSGRGVHILTFNDYLARRDAEWMGPIYEALGLSVGVIQEDSGSVERRRAYNSDVTYATAKEAGFDFLRAQLCRNPQDIVLRPYNMAIVDEADSILIDEARTPLVIAGDRERSDVSLSRIRDIVTGLQPGIHWETDENDRNVHLTEDGLSLVESRFGNVNLHAPEHYILLTEINQALHAHVLLHRDVDYIVRAGQIELVDEFTGRVVSDRRWPDGLQAALETKEGVTVRPGGSVLGSITMQHFLGHYEKLAGMTATAQPAAEELVDFYGLKVAPIPPNRPRIRKDLPDTVFTHREAKDRAIVDEIRASHRAGRPVLVGTRSVAESERLASLIENSGLKCRVLNAKNDAVEAAIIAEAGRPGAVTISTNMAGRGTDIKLGGADESERERVVRAGGLLVIGTNRHESRRIDDQLRGRAGRQGDPGASHFIAALDDDLMIRFGIDTLIPKRLAPATSEEPVRNPIILKEVDRLQRIVEGQNYDIRRTLLKYSSFVEEQRKRVQDWRMELLAGIASPELCAERAPDRYSELVAEHSPAIVVEAERQITLHHIDECWAEHLSFVTRVREGIHLVGLGGLKPLDEFRKQVGDAFKDLLGEIDERIVASFGKIDLGPDGLDLDREGMRGPSSTWTYLVNDRAVDELQELLFGQGSYATGAGAALVTGPLLIGWGIVERLRLRRGRRQA